MKKVPLLFSSLLAAGQILLQPVNASAAPPPCPDGSVCVWKDVDFQGCYATLPDRVDDYGAAHWSNCSGSLDRAVSSFSNQTKSCIIFGTDTAAHGGGKSAFPVTAGGSGNVPREFNDKFRSHEPGAGC